MTDWIPGDPDPTRPERAPTAHRHVWHERPVGGLWVCLRCGKVRDEGAARRGRTNRARGLRIQRERVRAAGGENIPGNGPFDGRAPMFRFESKSGGVFPERLWKWLRGIPVTTETPVLIVTEAPGPGRRARAVVVLDFDDWVSLHGGTNDDR